ncbi:MAG: 1-acyl-sn-glycerol-3-phosphate acyltransferase [Leptolyngbyaceae bacterium]|nr:1-acyl-sn-glycerol-3-phosphate acyltransferase [Leptolyngbyaceae bacterium]
MSQPITEAQPPLQFIPPRYTPWVLKLGRRLLPHWLRWQQDISHVELLNGAELVDLFEQFQAGKIRFMLAFRHPSTNDPPCIAQALWNELPKLARQGGNRLTSPPHIHFVYDRGIPLWAGQVVGWLISHLGGTPIRRGRLDTAGLRSIRELFASGEFPIAAAPEGGVNGHNEIVSPLEPGIAQFGFWCMDDLQKSDRSEAVAIVPLGVQYRFHVAPWATLADLLSQLEQDSGIQHPPTMAIADLTNGIPLTAEQESILYQRLHYLAEHLLTVMETFYRNYYQQPVEIIPPMKLGNEDTGARGDWAEKHAIAPRLQVLLDAALTVAEQSFGIKPKGTLTDRCRRLEQASWDRIYREDLKDLESLSAVERGLANLVAEDANLRIWHMHLVETFVSVTGKYVADNPTVERFADTLLLLWKMITQIKGQTKGEVSRVPKLGQRYAQLTVGTPISVSDRWGDYKTSRRKAVADLTDTLQQAMESLIR